MATKISTDLAGFDPAQPWSRGPRRASRFSAAI
jgi:hypothetical protein